MSDENNIGCTRLVHLDLGQVRDRERNWGTIVASLPELMARGALPFEALFLAHYRLIRELARNDAAGAGAVVIHAPSCRVAGRVWIARRPGRPNACIIGRHSTSDLVLEHPSVSLRHLAMVVPPKGELPGELTLHELRTPDGFYGELGQRMGGARVEGVGLFRLGAYALFTFATGQPERWPELASDAWRDLCGATSAVSVVRPLPREPAFASSSSHSPNVTAIRGPMQTNQRLMDAGELRAGTLQVSSEARRQRLAIGAEALKRGVLLGRYDRCDSEEVLVSTDISRVHLLVLQVGEHVYGIDTASTQGVFLDVEATRPERVVALSKGELAVLSDGQAVICFRR